MSETAEAYKKAVQFFMDEFIAPALKPREPVMHFDEKGNHFQQDAPLPTMALEHIEYYQEEFNDYIDRYFKLS